MIIPAIYKSFLAGCLTGIVGVGLRFLPETEKKMGLDTVVEIGEIMRAVKLGMAFTLTYFVSDRLSHFKRIMESTANGMEKLQLWATSFSSLIMSPNPEVDIRRRTENTIFAIFSS